MLLLLDTSSVFYRAHHALPPMNTKSGEHTAAIYGFSVLLLKLLREMRPAGIAFARDLPQPTFRHEAYAEYKAGRPPLPDAMRTQWGRLAQLIAAVGAPSHAVPGFEADDVLATLARRLSGNGEAITVVSGDRDLFQTVTPLVEVLFMGARGQKSEKVDPSVVATRYGVVPTSMPTWSALVGESADNLIGVPGVGARTASKLVAEYLTAENLFAHLDDVTPIKLRESLRASRDRVLSNEKLARLRDDLELLEPLVGPVSDEALTRMNAVFEELEFKSLIARVEGLRSTAADRSAPKPRKTRAKLDVGKEPTK